MFSSRKNPPYDWRKIKATTHNAPERRILKHYFPLDIRMRQPYKNALQYMLSMYIAVGSTNQVKVNAVKLAVSHQWPDVIVEGFETNSGVGEQPRTDHETYIGSINRARSALEEMRGKYGNNAEILGVGLEGGVDESEDGLLNVVWCSVVDGDGKVYSSSGARFILDDEIASRILGGEEMGPIMDSLLNEKDTKKKGGMIGVVTRNFYNRTEEYASIARLTIGLWYGSNWRDLLG